jgi:hypothetical protein
MEETIARLTERNERLTEDHNSWCERYWKENRRADKLQARLDAALELVEKWRKKRSVVSPFDRGLKYARNDCADDLEAVLKK